MRKQIVLAAIFFSFSVASKLLPLMFLPLLFFVLEWKKAIKFYLITGLMILLLFVPFLNQEMITNLGSSVNLYFQKFEFNASIYYVIRWIGYQVKGYNIIQTAGVRLSYFVVAFIFIMSLSKPFDYKSLFIKMLFAISIYFFTATIIHPWYVCSLVAISIFTEFKFSYLWSALAIVSYATYNNAEYKENLLLTTLEYTLVYGYLIYELQKYNYFQQFGRYIEYQYRYFKNKKGILK
ncbi:hypothetical protein [Chondrinema litorale]|uniref:hypothetical protein n=1 Tax=Chondrinema litorale TaxID=2994555 RepID=UPI002542837E|nr:hypothetical protein [Chondrinema litorale]UZR94469.1 hypothetical protein OQ292_01380 [Chondrinema litorale]